MGSDEGKSAAVTMSNYTVSGTGRATVFLLHGIYGSKEYWHPQTERLVARGYRVVAWDAPGYGLSPLPDPFTFDVMAEAGAQLIRALGSERTFPDTGLPLEHSSGAVS
jgi:pimeloyl-ACP methyl ester carboxylesterase